MRLNALSSGRQANPQLISKKRGKHHGQRQNRLHADSAGIMTKTYYTSTLTYGTQRYDKGDNRTYYEGCTFNMTER